MDKKQITIVVAVIQNKEGEILFAKRNEPETQQIHNMWEFPGGKIEFGEDPESAVIREVREETGLEIKIKRLLPKIYTHLWDNLPTEYQVILLAYECESHGGLLNSNDLKIAELKYFEPQKINYNTCLPKMKEIIDLSRS